MTDQQALPARADPAVTPGSHRRHGRTTTRGAVRRVVFETESKLRAPLGFTLPRFTAVAGTSGSGPDVVVGDPVVTRLETTYHDSGDLALATLGISLRYRTGEHAPHWTLKMPGAGPDGGGSRSAPVVREISFDGDGDRVPAAARDLLHVQLRSRLLLSVARLDSRRTSVTVSSRGGVPLAEVVHDEVSAYRGSQLVTRFGEVEVQAVDLDRAGDELRRALVHELVTAGCTPAPAGPKLLHTFGVLSPIGLPAVSPRTTARSVYDVLTVAIASSLERLADHDIGVRLDEDIEDVHQLRVATRRLRSDLRTFGYLLDPDWQRHLRDELGWLGSLAGPVRDADVLLLRLDAGIAALPEPDSQLGRALTSRLEDERARDRDALIAGMRSARYDLLLDSLADAATSPQLRADGRRRAARSGAAALTRALGRQWGAVAAAVGALGDSPTVAELHQVRIRAKRCRYAAEASAPVLGKPARRLAAAATEIQTVLGDLHDAVVAQEWLRDAVQFEPTAACAGGQLIAAERTETDRLRASWQQVWRTVEPEAARALARLDN